MIDHLLREIQVLRKVDFLIAKIWLDFAARRFGLLALACLIAVFGLAMANVAGLYALQGSMGSVSAAAVVALIDLGIAVVMLLIAKKSRPGPELDVAFELRKVAVDSLQAEARDLMLTLDAIGREVKDVKANIAQLVQNPLDVAAQKLLIPAALSVLRGVRARKGHA